MLTYYFPGQGSQKKGMGKELFEAFPEHTAIADRVLGYSIAQLCTEDPDNQLNLTQFTQPALYVVNALTFLKKMQDEPQKPDFLAGHSLGEYNALFAAGAFDFETGLRLVQKRGQLMGEAEGGGMAAVVGMPEDKVREILGESGKTSIDIANLNSPHQIVLSGPKDDINDLKDVFKAAGVRMYMPLKVSAAFHSRYMKPASDAFRAFLEQFQFSPLNTPVISNVEARPYPNDRVADLLAAQIVSSVKWTETIRYLMGKGVQEFQEVGPGKVLAGLYKKIKAEAEPLVVDDQPSRDASNPAVAQVGEPAGSKKKTLANRLGSEAFRQSYGLNYAYMAGGMYGGISSVEMVLKLAQAGCLGSFGSGGLTLPEVESALNRLQTQMPAGVSFAVNVVNDAENETFTDQLIATLLTKNASLIEAANFIQMTPALVRFRLSGCHQDQSGRIVVPNKIIGKATRPEVAKAFLSPPPKRLVDKLVQAHLITQEEAALAPHILMADDLIAQADGAWHTDQSLAFSLLPSLRTLRQEIGATHAAANQVRIGAAGGIGSPESVAAAFVLGADFVVTGSINQATVEADTSAEVKNLLEQMNVQDTEYAPAGDLFEFGAKVQLLKRGLFFPARANKLFDLYRHYNSLESLDEKTKNQLETRFFKRSLDEVWQDVLQQRAGDRAVESAERNPKAKMALVFKWYYGKGLELAKAGTQEEKVDFQIFCGPALGALNQWLKHSSMASWQNRHVDVLAEGLMNAGAEVLAAQLAGIAS